MFWAVTPGAWQHPSQGSRTPGMAPASRQRRILGRNRGKEQSPFCATAVFLSPLWHQQCAAQTTLPESSVGVFSLDPALFVSRPRMEWGRHWKRSLNRTPRAFCPFCYVGASPLPGPRSADAYILDLRAPELGVTSSCGLSLPSLSVVAKWKSEGLGKLVSAVG